MAVATVSSVTQAALTRCFRSRVQNGFNTYGRDISNNNVVSGYSTDSSGILTTDTEFTRSSSGVITALTNPITLAPLHGIVGEIDSLNAIVGDYIFTSGGLNYRHGYLINGSTFTDISASALNTEKTQARGINDAGLIVGFVRDSITNQSQGFVDNGGAITLISDPNPLNASTTFLESVNNSGLASGEFQDAFGSLHPFIYNTLTSTFTDLTPPTADSYFAFGVNNLGDVILAGQLTGINYSTLPRLLACPNRPRGR